MYAGRGAMTKNDVAEMVENPKAKIGVTRFTVNRRVNGRGKPSRLALCRAEELRHEVHA